MQQVKKASFINELCDHVEVGLTLQIETHAHIQDDVRMTQRVEHLDLLNKVFESLSGHVAFAKLLDSDFCAHPSCFKNVTVSTASDQICLLVDL